MINSSLSSKCNNNIHCSSKPQSPQAMKLVACLRFIYCVHLAKSFLDAITQFKRASRMKIHSNLVLGPDSMAFEFLIEIPIELNC